MKNKNKNRYFKLLERLESNAKFKLELRKIRTLYEIPVEDGFDNDAEYRKWEQECIQANKYNRFLLDESPKLAEFAFNSITQISPNTHLTGRDKGNLKNVFFLYICRGKKAMRYQPQLTFCFVNSLDKSYIDFLKRNYKDSLMIIIPPNAEHQEVRKYVDHRLKDRRLFIENPKPFILRKYKESDIENEIIKLCRKYGAKTIAELRNILNKDKTMISYRHYAYKYLLKKEANLDAETEHIKTIIRRWMKRKGVN